MKARVMAAFAALALAAGAKEPVDCVNTFIGTDAKGHCNPGATRPFAMVQPGPDTGEGDWPYCAGYQYKDPTLMGFSQNHLCGCGQGEMGDVLLLPFCGEKVLRKSTFDHKDETSSPGFYSVKLGDAQVKAEITSTERVAYHRYTYLGDGPKRLLVDLQHGLVGEAPWAHRFTLAGRADFAADRTGFTGLRHVLQYWPEHRVYFTAVFSRPFVAKQLLKNEYDTEKGDRWVLDFDLKKGETLEVKVALSYGSVEGAKKNLAAELPGWNFEEVRATSRKQWSDILSRVEVEGATDDQRVALYTALYHLCFQPNVISDVGAKPRYSTFSFWDTYRSAHPLYTLVTPERVDGFVDSILDHAEKTGFMPIWEIYGLEGYDMIGAHSIPVVLDAWRKGFKVDLKAFFPHVRRTLTHDNRPKAKKDMHHSHWDKLDRLGYFPCDVVHWGSLSRVMETTMDDWCAAEMAKELGLKEDEAFFRRRSETWRNSFNPGTGLLCPRLTDGSWLEPYNPEWPIRPKDHPKGFCADTTEGTGLQWSFHVLHDVPGLIERMGGREKFVERLDYLFSHRPFWEGRPELEMVYPYREICGRMGEYAHGNEPCHHIAWLYALAGERGKTADLVRRIALTQYPNRPDGVCGNDDCGQVSSWYVFAALGFYPVNPAAAEYVLGEPVFDKATLRMPNGRILTIRRDPSAEGVTLNGRSMSGAAVSHAALLAGGELVFGKDVRDKAADGQSTDRLPCYDEAAFPPETRPAEAQRIAADLEAVVRRAEGTDALCDAAFSALETNAFERIRLGKRREVRARTEAFARRYLSRGDATGLGFAEQATADLELMDRILREEAENFRRASRPENDPVVLNLSDFGAKGDGRTDDGPAFMRAFDAIRALNGKPSVLRLGKGTFLIATARKESAYTSPFGHREDGGGLWAGLPVRELANCAMEGESPETTVLRFGAYDKVGIAFLDCRNCALRRVDCAFAQQPFLEGEVLAVERQADLLSVDLRLVPGSLRPDAPSWDPPQKRGVESFGYEFRPTGGMIQSARLIHWDSRSPDRCRDLGNGVWRIFFRRDFDPANFDRHLQGLVVGGYLAIPNRCNFFPTLRIADCSHMLVEDVWIRNSRSGAVDAYCRSYMTSFHRLRVFPLPGFHQSTNADGCFCSPGTFLLDCSFEAMGDDGMNSLSNITCVNPSADGLEVTRQRDWGSNPKGSLVVFLDPGQGRYLANRRVREGDEPGRMTTRLKRPVPPSVDGKLMIAPRFRGIGTIVSGCSWKDGRWTGVVLQTPNALVENCTFDNLWQEAVRMCFFGDWNEGLPPYNVLVRNCRVSDCGGGVITRYQHSSDGRKTWAKPVASPIRAIDVTGCTFRNTPRGALVFACSGDCGFAGNVIEDGSRRTDFTACEEMRLGD